MTSPVRQELAKTKTVIIPAVACALDWSRLPAPRRGGGSPCICRKSFLPMLVLSFPDSFCPTKTHPLLVAVNDPATRQIIRRKLDGYFVSRQNADEILAHLPGNVRQDLVLVFQFYAEHGVRKRLDHGCHDFNGILFRVS